jgi:hypothetical protein
MRCTIRCAGEARRAAGGHAGDRRREAGQRSPERFGNTLSARQTSIIDRAIPAIGLALNEQGEDAAHPRLPAVEHGPPEGDDHRFALLDAS